MIGLKKKQQEAAAAAAAATNTTPQGDVIMNESDQNGNDTTKNDSTPSSTTTASPAAVAAAGRGASAGAGRGATIWGVKGAAGTARGGGRKLRPGEIRIQKDISELDGGDCATPNFPDANDLMNFEVTVAPDAGYWAGYEYTFKFTVPDMYPHEPPKVKCVDKIFHPNIDLGGNVCLNILRADWKPVLDINAVIYGLIVLFVQPNPDDPLNHDAAKMLRENPVRFKQCVEKSLRGMDVDGVSFPPARKATAKASRKT
jgi:ubiquitin-conjugating enzyme E2 M